MRTRSKKAYEINQPLQDQIKQVQENQTNVRKRNSIKNMKENQNFQNIQKKKMKIQKEAIFVQKNISKQRNQNQRPSKLEIKHQMIQQESSEHNIVKNQQIHKIKRKIEKIQQHNHQQSNSFQFNQQNEEKEDEQQLQRQRQNIQQQQKRLFNENIYRFSVIQTYHSPDNKYKTIKGLIYYEYFQVQVKNTYTFDYFRQNRDEIQTKINCKLSKLKRNIQKHMLNGQFWTQLKFWNLRTQFFRRLQKQNGQKHIKELQQILYYTCKSPIYLIKIGKNPYLSFSILSRIKFQNLKVLILTGEINNLEPITWINCHHLQVLKIKYTNIADFKPLNKIYFKRLKMLKIIKNKMPQMFFERIKMRKRMILQTFQKTKDFSIEQRFEQIKDFRKTFQLIQNQDISLLVKSQNFSQQILGLDYEYQFEYPRIPQQLIVNKINPYSYYTFESQNFLF